MLEIGTRQGPQESVPRAERQGTWRGVFARASTAVAGLVLAVAANMAPQGIVGGQPAARPSIHLPGWTGFVAAGALIASSLLVLWPLLPRFHRRRRKNEPEFVLYHEPPRLTLATLVTLLAVSLAPIGVLGYLLWEHEEPLLMAKSPPDNQRQAPATLASPSDAPSRAPAALPFVSDLYLGIVLIATLGPLGVLLWFRFGDRVFDRRQVLASPRLRARLAQAVGESLDDLRMVPDARAAVIKCYRRFEDVVAAAELPRRPWETPKEFMRRALPRLPVPEGSIACLTRLFELSRFSCRPVGAADREFAWQSLVEIKESLEKDDSNAKGA